MSAFEITIDDLQIAANSTSEQLFGSLDHAAIEKAALNGDGIDEQTSLAHQEIRRQVEAMGHYADGLKDEEELQKQVALAMGSCLENYIFEIQDSVAFSLDRKLSTDELERISTGVTKIIEKHNTDVELKAD